MTLQEFFDFLGSNPRYITGYFMLIPLVALLANWVCKGEGHLSPWKYLYATLIFAVCVPGVFSVALSVYFFLFQRGSILNTNILTQILPVLSMVLTITTIRRNVSLRYIPGTDRISSLMMLIGSVLVLMYILDRTHIIVWVRLPAVAFLGILIGLLIVMRWTIKSITK